MMKGITIKGAKDSGTRRDWGWVSAVGISLACLGIGLGSVAAGDGAVPKGAPGAFGFRMGMTIGELRAAGSLTAGKDNGVYQLVTTPRSPGGVDTFVLVYTPQTGLCKVEGMGADIDDAGDGVNLRQTYAALKDTITMEFGKPTLGDIDSLRANSETSSVERAARGWMAELASGDRALGAMWPGHGDIEDVRLLAAAYDARSGYITESYEFKNSRQCFAIIKGDK